MASQDWFEKDFYKILGVPKDADEAAIKKAYRKLARQYHPDKNPGDTVAEQKFKEIGEAHSVLSDPTQREEYDAIRQMAAGGARFTAGGPGSAGNGGFEDIFSAFGGGAGGRAGARSTYRGDDYGDFGGFGGPTRGPRKGQDLEARTTLSFRDAVTGSTVTLQTAEGRTITTRIPAGVRDGQRIRLRGKGMQGDPGAEAGDLILTVTVGKHPVFGREGDNLTLDLPVSFPEATLGATVAVPTLDGEQVKVRIAPGTPSGRVLRVKGRGVHSKKHTGDLLAKVVVTVPTHLSEAAKAAVEAVAKETADVDPRAELFAKAGS